MRLEYLCPARGLIGYRSQFLTDTRGTGILNHNFKNYGPYAGTLQARARTACSSRRTTARPTPTASSTCRSAGSCSSGPQIKVYGGQIIGLHSRDNDLVVNPSKAKKLTNIRTTAADEKLFLTPPRVFTLESALEFINDDELVEVTPEGDPPAQARPRPQRAQAPREAARRRASESASDRRASSASVRRAPACARAADLLLAVLEPFEVALRDQHRRRLVVAGDLDPFARRRLRHERREVLTRSRCLDSSHRRFKLRPTLRFVKGCPVWCWLRASSKTFRSPSHRRPCRCR